MNKYIELFLENIPESFHDEKGQLVFLSPSQEVKDNFTDFFKGLPEYYRNIIDFENDVSTTLHGTITIDWNYKNSNISVEVGKTLIGFYSETPDKSNPKSDGILCKEALDPIVKILNDIYDRNQYENNLFR